MANEPLPPREVAPDEWTWKKEEDPPFHRLEYNANLVRFHDKLFSEGKTGRVFVPLCGKSLDMIYLADHGHEVVGLEFSEIGVECFFNEHNLTYVKTDVENAPFVKYEANKKKITIFRGDLFDLQPGICDKFDAIWDRGSYVAINVPTRQTYADLMHALLNPGGKILSETYIYDPTKMSGPPHVVTEDNLKADFGRKFTIEVLDIIPGKAPPHFKVDMDFNSRICLIVVK